MVTEGLPKEDATRRFWCVDLHGLLVDDMGDKLQDYQAGYARPASEVKTWQTGGGLGLAETIRRVHPTILIGNSGVSGAVTEAMVREMGRHTDRPIVFPFPSPPPQAETTLAYLITRAFVAQNQDLALGQDVPFGQVLDLQRAFGSQQRLPQEKRAGT